VKQRALRHAGRCEVSSMRESMSMSRGCVHVACLPHRSMAGVAPVSGAGANPPSAYMHIFGAILAIRTHNPQYGSSSINHASITLLESPTQRIAMAADSTHER